LFPKPNDELAKAYAVSDSIDGLGEFGENPYHGLCPCTPWVTHIPQTSCKLAPPTLQYFPRLCLKMTLKLKTQSCIHSQIFLHPMTK